MSDSDDPLSVGHCQFVETKVIPPPETRVLRRASAVAPGALLALSHEERKKRRKSFKKVYKTYHLEFELEMPRSKMTNSPSLTSMPDLSLTRVITDEQRSEFDKFIVPESGDYKFGAISEAIKSTRKQLFGRYVEDARKILAKLKVQLNQCLDKRSEQMKTAEAVLERLQGLHRMGAEQQRKNAAFRVIACHKQMKIEKLTSGNLKRDMERTVVFIEFLKGLEERFPLLPMIDLEAFENSFEPRNEKVKKLKKQVRALKARVKEIVEQKPGTGDWYFNLMHPKSKTGKIIKRFEARIGQLGYEDVYTIIEHLSEDRDDFSRLEQLLFDLAWQREVFPFGLMRKIGLPTKGDLFPAVVGQTLVDQEYAFIPFSTLNGMDWPFKPAVDMIFEMLILTNPFDIARVYWDVIQEAAQCMQRVLVKGGMKPEDVEIDFDSLFPILMICVFVFGIDEWMTVALYTVSFNEHVTDDPQLQFAMTYLEGLVTHIMALDKETLRRKASEMRNKWADEQSDPLGVH